MADLVLPWVLDGVAHVTGASIVLLMRADPASDDEPIVLAYRGEPRSNISLRVRSVIRQAIARELWTSAVRHMSPAVVIVGAPPDLATPEPGATVKRRFLVAVGPFQDPSGFAVVDHLKRAAVTLALLDASGPDDGRPMSLTIGPGGEASLTPVPNDDGVRQLALISTVTRALTRLDAADNLLPVLARETAIVLHADRVGIYVYCDDGTSIASHHWFGTTGGVIDDTLTAVIDLDTSPLDHPDERRMIAGPRVYANDEIIRNSTPGQPQTRALAPLVGHDRILGCVWVVRDRHDPFSTDEIALLEVIGNQGAFAVSRSRLVEDERRQRRSADALREVAVSRQDVHDFDGLLTKVAAVVGAAVGVDRVGIHAYDATHQASIAAGYFGYPYEPGFKEAVRTLPPAEIPAEAEVMRTRRTLVRGMSTPFKSPFTVATRRSDVVVPLIADRDVEGVMYVWEDDADHVFSTDDIHLLETIGHQVGQVFVRVRDRERASRRANHLHLVNQVGRSLAGIRDVDSLCQVIYAEVSQVLTTDAFIIALYQGGGDTIDLRYLVDDGVVYPAESRPVDDSQMAWALMTRGPHVYQRSHDEEPVERFRFGSRDRRVQSALFVPMLHDGQVIGVISVQRYDDAQYDADDLNTLETIAQQAATALAIAGLHEETVSARRSAERRANDLATILAASQALAEAHDAASVLEQFSAALISLVPHDDLIIVQARDEATWLPIYHARASDTGGRIHPKPSLWWGQDVFGASWSSREVTRAAGVPTGFLAVEDRTWGQVISTPMLAGSESPEVVLLARWDAAPWSDDEITAIQLLTGQAAAAITNIRFLAESHRAEARIARHAANLEAVLDTTLSVTAEVSLDATLNTLADHVARLIPHESLVILHTDEHTGHFETLFSRRQHDQMDLAGDLVRDRVLLGRIVSEGAASLINDAPLAITPADLDAPAGSAAAELDDGRSRLNLIGAPLQAAGQPIGVIVLGRTGTFRFGQADLEVFRILAAQAGVALQTSLLIEKERRRRRQAAALVEIVASLNRSLTLNDIAQSLTAGITAAVGVDRSVLWVYDETLSRTIIAVRYFGDRDGEELYDTYANATHSASPYRFPVEREIMTSGEVFHGERLERLFGNQRHEHWDGQRGGAVIPVTIRG